MGRIGHTSFPTHYEHTERHTRHPSGCLPSGLSSVKPSTFLLSSSIEPIGPSKSSTYLWTKQGNNDFSSFKSYRSLGMTRTRTQRSTKRRRTPFMTDTFDDDHSRSMIRSGSTILALSSFIGSYALDGIVLTWFWSCSMADLYSFLTSNPADNSR